MKGKFFLKKISLLIYVQRAVFTILIITELSWFAICKPKVHNVHCTISIFFFETDIFTFHIFHVIFAKHVHVSMSNVLPTMTMGGETSVRMSRQRTNIPTMTPSRLIRSMSVILTALALRTRKITEILRNKIQTVLVSSHKKGGKVLSTKFEIFFRPR